LRTDTVVPFRIILTTMTMRCSRRRQHRFNSAPKKYVTPHYLTPTQITTDFVGYGCVLF